MAGQFILCILLVVAGLQDIKELRISNKLSLGIFLLGFLQVLLQMDFWGDKVLGSILGFSFMFALAWVSGGLGGGDIKLMGAVGMWIGVCGTLKVMVLAFLLSGIAAVFFLATKKKKKEDGMAFGPYIAIAVIIETLGGILS